MLQRLDAARIEPPRLLHGLDRLVVAAHRAQELAEGAERFDRAGIEGDRMREVGLGAVPVPVVLHLHPAQRGPRLGQPLVEGDRPLGRSAGHRHRLIDLQRPQHRRRRHQQIGRAEPGMRHGIVGIERQRLFEQGQCLHQRQPREGLEMGPRLELQEIGLRRPRSVAVQAGGRRPAAIAAARRRPARRSRPATRRRRRRDCSKCSLHCVRPLATSIRRAETLQPLGVALHRALQQVTHAERAARRAQDPPRRRPARR